MCFGVTDIICLLLKLFILLGFSSTVFKVFQGILLQLFYGWGNSGTNMVMAAKSTCLMLVGLILVMELTTKKKFFKGTGCTFWQLSGRQERWDLLQVEPGPAAAADD